MSEKSNEIQEAARQSLADPSFMEKMVDYLSDKSRRKRQNAASILNAAAHIDAQKLQPYIGNFIDCLDLKEAQTRWESLEALAVLVSVDSRACDRALDGAEVALFDEDNGLLRLAAVRFLCALGATTEKRSEKVWPLLDEAIQCYHGDPEFQEMLVAVTDFSAGKIASEVKEQLKLRMTFDAENGKGALKARASQIVANLQ